MPVDVLNGDGYTALQHASMCNKTDVIKHLLHEGADVNRQNRCEDTALHLAAYYDCPEAVQMLVDNLADVNLINDLNETPLDEARKGSEVERLLQQVQQSAP